MSEAENLSEEEIKRLQAELARVTVDDVLLQTIVTLINLGARKAGLIADQQTEGQASGRGASGESQPGDASLQTPAPDYEQLRLAIEGARALLPLLDPSHNDKLGPIRDSLSHLQMIYVQNSAASDSGASATTSGSDNTQPGNRAGVKGSDGSPSDAGKPGSAGEGRGPAERSGRLWVPGQK